LKFKNFGENTEKKNIKTKVYTVPHSPESVAFRHKSFGPVRTDKVVGKPTACFCRKAKVLSLFKGW
jgi:hypothetical protein